MMKVFEVFTMDEWHNITKYGVYSDLKIVEKEIREDYKDTKWDEPIELVLRTGSWGDVFDTEVQSEDSGEYLRVFGFTYQIEGNVFTQEVISK